MRLSKAAEGITELSFVSARAVGRYSSTRSIPGMYVRRNLRTVSAGARERRRFPPPSPSLGQPCLLHVEEAHRVSAQHRSLVIVS